MVVPAISLTINLSSFINLLIKVDLPAFGLPRIATFLPSGNSMSAFVDLFSSSCLILFKFFECSALISR